MTEQTTDREDAITDVALEDLVQSLTPGDERYADCAGCNLLVHHTDLTTHARECAPLRAKAAGVVDG